VNSSHFLSLGVIPSMYTDVTYAGLRDRPEAKWYSDEMREFLSGKLGESNKELPTWRRKLEKIHWVALKAARRARLFARRMLGKR